MVQPQQFILSTSILILVLAIKVTVEVTLLSNTGYCLVLEPFCPPKVDRVTAQGTKFHLLNEGKALDGLFENDK